MCWVYGNADLNAEKGLHTSLSAEYTKGALNVSVSGYNNKISNKITQYEIINSIGSAELYYKNVSSATLQGLDVNAQYCLLRELTLKGSYSFCDAVDNSTGLQLESNVKHSGRVAATWNGSIRKSPFSLQLAGRLNSPKLYQEIVTAANGAEEAILSESKPFSIWKAVLVKPFQIASIVKANNDDFVRYEAVSAEDLGRLSRYDFVLGFGMGMRITAEQRTMIQVAADKGVPVYIHAATNPANAICGLYSVQLKQVRDYLDNGNKRNYQNLTHYVRQHIDNKRFFVTAADTAVKTVSDVIYHLDENVWFEDVNAYEEYLRSQSYYVEGGARIAIVGGFNDPFSGNRENIDSLIVGLQGAGMNVYPVIAAMKRLEFLKAIRPDAVIYFAHGRLSMGQADAAVEWIKASNIPLFTPLSLLVSQSQWEVDKMGMSGGFLSQSIVMPELDGAIYPYSLNVQELDDEDLFLFKAIPSRLKSFVRIVDNFIALKRKSNADKRLAIYYFKGAGQSTLAAQGLETVPALYNFLKHLRAEGYNVADLPDDVKGFEHLLMSQGAVMSTYAEGAFDEFLKNGRPALIEKSEYEAWARQSLETSLYEDVVNAYGEAPGKYMAVHRDDKSYIVAARIQLGNIVLLPQPMAGLGSDAFAIVHGAKAPPPHTYIAAYLWAQHAFRADAVMHFGTHGSLEFTPQKQVALGNFDLRQKGKIAELALQKQVALGNFDWPDRLVGSMLHFYYYTIGNIGESMMAKRRSYATIVSYLTPAFMETETRAQFKTLQEKIRHFHKTEGEQAQTAASLDVKRIALEMGLHRDLRLDSLPATPYSASEIERIENFAEEIANEKMNGHLYTSSVPYGLEKIRSTVVAMSADPVAYSIAKLERLSGKVDEAQLKSKTFFTQKYLEPAKTLVNKILDGMNVSDELICSLAGVRQDDLSESKKILAPPRRTMPASNDNASNGNASSSMSGAEKSASKPSSGGHPSWIPKIGQRPEETKKDAETKPTSVPPPAYTTEQKAKARAIVEIERTVRNI
jgi:cobaltochelatase CobN